jgi:peptidylprolyl isomerase
VLSDDEKDVLMLQDKRTLGENNKLLNYLNSKEEKVVIKALYAIANIADENTVEKTGEILLKNSDPKIRSAAAFALGQIPCAASESILSQSLSSEKDSGVLISILNAIGKIGSETELDHVININIVDNKVLSAKAISIARFAIRKIRNENSVAFLRSLVNSTQEAEVQNAAAYALWRSADKDLLLPAREELLKMIRSTEPETRMWSVNALSRLQDISDINLLLENLRTESDWKVKINILNSLPGYKAVSENFLDQKLITIFDALSIDNNSNVRITALSTLGKLFSNLKEKNNVLDNVKTMLESYFLTENEKDWQEIGEAINSYGMIFKDDSKETLFTALYKSDDYDIKPYIIRAFSYFDDPMIFRPLKDSIMSDVKKYATRFNVDTKDIIGSYDLLKIYRAFVETLTMLDKKMDEESLNITRLIYSEFTSSKDPYLVSMCLNKLKDSLYLQYREETNAIISFDYSTLSYPDDYDVILLFIDAFGELKSDSFREILENNLKSQSFEIASYSAKTLEKITGKQYQFDAKPRYDFDWNTLEQFYKKRFATIYLDIGNIKIELMPEIAPFTVLNFVKLASSDKYYGKIFFRIVPNFVIQGGDWSNSGEGSYGYTIRSEFSDFSFVRGVVGMASSGKDTECSQFFIMHSPHYHLDGRYTSFGIVKEGFDVLDNVIYGNTIEKITFSEF